jgi:hypothetical protein
MAFLSDLIILVLPLGSRTKAVVAVVVRIWSFTGEKALDFPIGLRTIVY